MKVELNLPELPVGYEYTGEFRKAIEGEYWLCREGRIIECVVPSTMHHHIIVRKSKTEVELLQERLDKLYLAAIEGIQYVGIANYAEREKDALYEVEKIYHNWKESE